MGLINIKVSGELLNKLLSLDTTYYGNVEIVNAYKSNDMYDTIIFTLSNENFPSTPEIPFAMPIVHREVTRIVDWGIEKSSE
jgi:hypothetical protein